MVDLTDVPLAAIMGGRRSLSTSEAYAMRPTLADTLRFAPKPSTSPQAEAAKPIDPPAVDATAANTATTSPASVVFPSVSPDDAEADATRDFILGLGWKIEGLAPRPDGLRWWHITASRSGRTAWSMGGDRMAVWREVMAQVVDAEGRIVASRVRRMALNAVKRARRAIAE